MERVAIVYASRYSQTASIAPYIQEKLAEISKNTLLVEMLEVSERGGHIDDKVDTVFLSAPVYAGRFQLLQRTQAQK